MDGWLLWAAPDFSCPTLGSLSGISPVQQLFIPLGGWYHLQERWYLVHGLAVCSGGMGVNQCLRIILPLQQSADLFSGSGGMSLTRAVRFPPWMPRASGALLPIRPSLRVAQA